MVRRVDAIFSHGAFRPLEPPEGTRVHLSVGEQRGAAPARIHTPKLAPPEEAEDFVMEVRETGNAGLWRYAI